MNQVAEKITRPDFLAGQGLGNELGFWIFDYAPEHELQVRAYLNFLPSLMARQHPGIKMAQVNLLEVLKDYLTERGFLDKAIAMQKSKGDAALLKALRGPLHMDKFAPYLIRHSLSHDPDIVLLTGVGSLWPMVRAHSLLNALHGPLGHKPLVLFYPGRYDGQTMSLFKQIKSNNYYRAFALVP
ncbi:cytoplasmic protein [Halomonas sp. 'Soap Lake |nr:cytoplasmic protein [Halomonas sp. 'Soap Lake \